MPLGGGAQSDPRTEYYNTWARTDGPITAGLVNRTWIWGLGPYTHWETEPYLEAPGGMRDVQYFHKSRMEINDPTGDRSSAWFVTNGLLATELITGNEQRGDNTFMQRSPAQVQIAGDPHPDSPTYADLQPLMAWGAIPTGWTLTQRLNSDGSVSSHDALTAYGVTAAYYVPQTEHTVASVFWEFMTSTGMIFENGQYQQGSLFHNAFFATGYPIIEAYWVNVPVGGVWQDVLVQCFERRCLTFTPGNSAGWQVETGNIGQHYYIWRYGEDPGYSLPHFNAPQVSAPAPPPPPPPGCVNINTASFDELRQIIHIDVDRAQQIINLRPFNSVDQLIAVSGIGQVRLDEIKAQGLACV
jgi:hypothetical protein